MIPPSGGARLFVFGGLPGTGKTTLARRLAQALPALYLRVDTIEQALREAGHDADGPAGYNVAYHVAGENLRLGHAVVADSVNPLELTRAAWRAVAARARVPVIEIEVRCSDPAEHQRRVETRTSDLANFPLPGWAEVQRRSYDPWPAPHLILDSAGASEAQSFQALWASLTRAPSDDQA